MKISINHRLCILLGIVAVGLSLVVAEAAWTIYGTVLHETRTSVKQKTQNAYSILAAYGEKAKKGELSEAQAKQLAKEAIGTMRHGEHGYFWIHDLDMNMVMHPIKPKLNGKDVSKVKDKSGEFLFAEFNKVVKSNGGSGFHTYYWGKTGAAKNEAFAKESFIKLYQPWGYIVGTGVYIDDLNAKVWGELRLLILVAVALLIGSVFVCRMIIRSINDPLADVQKAILTLAQGDTDIDVDDRRMPSELSAIA